MQRYVKTNAEGYSRDMTTGAVINMNDAEYQRILLARKQKTEMESLTGEVSGLKQEMSEIKNMLTLLINGKNNG